MSLGGTGIRDWLIQRFSAAFLGIYALFILGYLAFTPSIEYGAWIALFSNPIMQLSTFIALVAIALHAWIGLTIVLTDYVKPLFLRYLLQGIFALVLIFYIVWGVFILWGN
jgi:succinate dehydrogenase / fumarate reductase membrane anchor subunit